MTDLLHPPCAEVEAAAWRCQRCGQDPGQSCGDTAARSAQEALRVAGTVSRDIPTSSEAPTVAPGWTTVPVSSVTVDELVAALEACVTALAVCAEVYEPSWEGWYVADKPLETARALLARIREAGA